MAGARIPTDRAFVVRALHTRFSSASSKPFDVSSTRHGRGTPNPLIINRNNIAQWARCILSYGGSLSLAELVAFPVQLGFGATTPNYLIGLISPCLS